MKTSKITIFKKYKLILVLFYLFFINNTLDAQILIDSFQLIEIYNKTFLNQNGYDFVFKKDSTYIYVITFDKKKVKKYFKKGSKLIENNYYKLYLENTGNLHYDKRHSYPITMDILKPSIKNDNFDYYIKGSDCYYALNIKDNIILENISNKRINKISKMNPIKLIRNNRHPTQVILKRK